MAAGHPGDHVLSGNMAGVPAAVEAEAHRGSGEEDHEASHRDASRVRRTGRVAIAGMEGI